MTQLVWFSQLTLEFFLPSLMFSCSPTRAPSIVEISNARKNTHNNNLLAFCVFFHVYPHSFSPWWWYLRPVVIQSWLVWRKSVANVKLITEQSRDRSRLLELARSDLLPRSLLPGLVLFRSYEACYKYFIQVYVC